MAAEQEFTEYVEARWSRLVRSAVLLGCSPPEAEDVVQTALTKCLVSWGRVRAADDRDAYVHRVLINTFTSSRRPRRAGERPMADVPDAVVAADTDAVDLRDAVLRALDRLSADQRAAVVLRYFLHQGEHQMAETLGVAPGTVKSRLSRAHAVLARDPDLAAIGGVVLEEIP